MKIKILYTVLLVLANTLPVCIDSIDHNTKYCYWHLRYEKTN